MHLVHHPESAFVRLAIDPKQLPRRVSSRKKKQGIELRPELPLPLPAHPHQEKIGKKRKYC